MKSRQPFPMPSVRCSTWEARLSEAWQVLNHWNEFLGRQTLPLQTQEKTLQNSPLSPRHSSMGGLQIPSRPMPLEARVETSQNHLSLCRLLISSRTSSGATYVKLGKHSGWNFPMFLDCPHSSVSITTLQEGNTLS